MKKFNKFFAVLFIIVLTSSGFAKNYNTEVSIIISRYLKGLEHPSKGVVESCILYVAQTKLLYPWKDYSKVIEKLDQIAVNDTCKTVRLKACIASKCMKDPEKFKWVKDISFEEMDELCSMMDEKEEEVKTLSVK